MVLKEKKKDFRIAISQPKLTTGLAKGNSLSSSRKPSINEDLTSVDPTKDLKAKSFNLNLNANQYLVKNTVN